jgi:ATP-binding cassette subfamily B protein
VIRYYGGDSTLEKIRNLSGTGKTGTSMLGLYQAANKCGLETTGYEATINDIKEYKNILILHVLIEERLEHYVICYGFDEGKFIIWDPAKGLSFMKEVELNKIWQSKKCLGLTPNKEFRSKKQRSGEKKRWILSMLRPDKDLLFVSAILGIIISALGLVMALFTQKLIDKILPSGDIKFLVISSLLVLLLLSSRIIISTIRQFFLLTQGKIFNVRVVDDFFSSLLQLPKWFFDTRKTGDFVARLNDTMRIQRVIADIVSIYIIDILVLCITIIVLFYYSKIAGLMSVIFIPVFYFLVSRWNNRIISSQRDLMAGYALNESNFIDSLKGILEIKSMNWQKNFSVRNKTIYSEFQERSYNLGKIKVKLNLIIGLAGSVYLILVLVWSSSQVMSAKMTQGELMAIISLSSALLPSVLNLALISIPASEVKVAINRMFEFTQIEPEDTKEENSGEQLNIQQVNLENISFRFPGQRLLMDNINLTIEKGKVVSIIGESGCGKSTLANILLKFYSPESGKILYNDGIVTDDISVNVWRSRVAIIPQEVHIFNGTILQNLITDVTEETVKELVSSVSEYGLGSFIDSFPSGLLTLIGEEGINLSGGQKQLLAFIRVLLKKPDILIIDEGTSNMDRGTEGLIIKLITRLKNKMGILLISHRLNMVKKLSDCVYVMGNRTISAKGTHNELITSENLYSRFWKDFE